MSKYSFQKGKLLFLFELLRRESDEAHPISMDRILSHLEANGIHAERKSIYSDVDLLRQMGYQVEQKKGRNGGYYLKSEAFELGELKLLVDAVQASRFIPSEKTLKLIGKLEGLTNKYAAGELHREVIVTGKVKSMNDSIFDNINTIYLAIHSNKSLDFYYSEWNVKKELVYRHDGKRYKVSPWNLLWTNENYYLIGYDEENKLIKYYRVDKMCDVLVSEDDRLGKAAFEKLDMSQFSNRTFNMYAGVERDIVLRCENELAGVILDRFGTNIPMYADEDDHFICHIRVQISKTFFGWLAGIGEKVTIQEPEDIKNEYEKFLMRLVIQFFREGIEL